MGKLSGFRFSNYSYKVTGKFTERRSRWYDDERTYSITDCPSLLQEVLPTFTFYFARSMPIGSVWFNLHEKWKFLLRNDRPNESDTDKSSSIGTIVYGNIFFPTSRLCHALLSSGSDCLRRKQTSASVSQCTETHLAVKALTDRFELFVAWFKEEDICQTVPRMSCGYSVV